MGNIEKYGVVALLFVIVMVVAVSIWGPKGVEGLRAETAPAVGSAEPGATLASATETNLLPVLPDESVAKPLTTAAGDPVSVPVVMEPAVAPSGSYRKYKIQKGDTLEGIALTHLGKKSKASEIVKLNEGIQPSRLRIGQEILLPEAQGHALVANEASAKPRESARVEDAALPKSYKTTRNDTLYDLAKKFYGNGGKWKKIYDANKSKIADPDTLSEGVELTIP